jgi:hypothetical protein
MDLLPVEYAVLSGAPPAKIGEGSGNRLGPQRVQGNALVGGPGGGAPR